jgi:hypothetical protein
MCDKRLSGKALQGQAACDAVLLSGHNVVTLKKIRFPLDTNV